VRRLDRFFDDGYEVAAQGVQVGLIAQPDAETFQRLRCIVFPAVEVTIHEPLHATPERVEERGYGQCRRNHSELGLLILAGQEAEHRLGSRHAAYVDEDQRDGE
jgi:hypothetical protein